MADISLAYRSGPSRQPGQSGQSTGTHPVVAALVTGAVLYFCFTARGRETLQRFERWLDLGEREAARLLSSTGRVVALAGALTDSLRSPHTT